MNFTDQKPRVATEEDCKLPWGGPPAGKRFRCYLCGHKFKVGDVWRWVYALGATFENSNGKKHGVVSPIVCESCDGEDVLDRWVAMNKEALEKYWWFCAE